MFVVFCSPKVFSLCFEFGISQIELCPLLDILGIAVLLHIYYRVHPLKIAPSQVANKNQPVIQSGQAGATCQMQGGA